MAGVLTQAPLTWVDDAVAVAEGAIESAEERLQIRRSQVWRYRVMGYSQNRIAQQLGVSQQTIDEDLKWCRANLPAVFETVADFRNISLARLEEMIIRVWSSNEIGLQDQVRAMAGLIDLQAKLLGGYAPTKVDAAVSVDYKITGIDTQALT